MMKDTSGHAPLSILILIDIKNPAIKRLKITCIDFSTGIVMQD